MRSPFFSGTAAFSQDRDRADKTGGDEDWTDGSKHGRITPRGVHFLGELHTANIAAGPPVGNDAEWRKFMRQPRSIIGKGVPQPKCPCRMGDGS